ncbi:MAG: hypothetical protein MJ202_09835, partial [Lentisphaeria bacterium]|nr:hypothetical protein [Lentisphaeria bacterium]
AAHFAGACHAHTAAMRRRRIKLLLRKEGLRFCGELWGGVFSRGLRLGHRTSPYRQSIAEI